MFASGVTLNLSEYVDLAAVNRDDIRLWNEAAAQRQADEAELNRMGARR
jgi:hypothetical protein